MLVVCPNCQAENEDVARFCNQCGSPLDNSLPENRVQASVPEAAAPKPHPGGGVNWGALVVIVLIIGAFWYIVGSHPKQGAGDSAGMPPMMPQETLEEITGLKTAMKSNPADMDSLRKLYEIYTTVGKIGQLAPIVQESIDYFAENRGNLAEAELSDAILGLFMVCYQFHDDPMALKTLLVYREKNPDNINIVKVLGDLSYDSAQFETAATYYEEYLAKADVKVDQENYLNAITDLGSCYIQLGSTPEGTEQPDAEASYRKALETFERAFAVDPGFWQARYNKGVALGKLKQVPEAVKEWEWCRDNTDSAMEKWRAEYAIAEIQGGELPPMPQNPHGEGFGDMSNPHGEGGMMNPHGEGGMVNPHGESGMVNPHGEGTAPPLDGDNMPENPHSEAWIEEHSKQKDDSGTTGG